MDHPVRIIDIPTDSSWIAGNKTNHERAKQIARSFAGPHLNLATGEPITINREGIDHTLFDARTPLHFQTTANLPELIREAAPYADRADKKGRAHIKKWIKFMVPVRYEGQIYPVKLTVKELHDGRRFYDHDISENKVSDGITATGKPIGLLGDATASDTLPLRLIVNSVNPDFLLSAPSPADDEAVRQALDVIAREKGLDAKALEAAYDKALSESHSNRTVGNPKLANPAGPDGATRSVLHSVDEQRCNDMERESHDL